MKMKRTLKAITLIALAVALLPACKKDRNPKPNKPNQPETGTVTIDGKQYGTVKIGTQTWTTVNFAGGNAGKPYDAANTRPLYGRYYTYTEVQALQLPAGWHVPTKQDFIKLTTANGISSANGDITNRPAIKNLTSTTGWLTLPGNNQSGFNALPAGYMFREGQAVEGELAEFWVANGETFSIQESPGDLRIRYFNNSSEPEYRFNLRLVKD